MHESDYHFFNDSNRSNGLIQVAGFATSGFGGSIVIPLSFRASRALANGDLGFRFDVVGDPGGTEISPELLFQRSDLVDISGT